MSGLRPGDRVCEIPCEPRDEGKCWVVAGIVTGALGDRRLLPPPPQDTQRMHYYTVLREAGVITLSEFRAHWYRMQPLPANPESVISDEPIFAVKASEAMQDTMVVATVHVDLDWRLRLGLWVVKLGARIMGGKVEIREES